MKESSDAKILAASPRVRGRGTMALVAGTIFFVLAMVIPLSIKSQSSTAKAHAIEDTTTLTLTSVTNSPTPFTHSILPNLDDDVISNSQDEIRIDFDDEVSNSRDDRIFTHLRPTSSPSGPPSRSNNPSSFPSDAATHTESLSPSEVHSSEPSARPIAQPSMQPSYRPSIQPSYVSSTSPSLSRSNASSVVKAFIPGLLTHIEHGLLLSAGLTARLIATSGQKVKHQDGSLSLVEFHEVPDFGAAFEDTRPENPGGWVYLSNSEVEAAGEGGVGSITFDRFGNILKYERVLSGTTMNCGGGKTPWNTWISCEETNGGRIYQVDPMGRRTSAPITLGSEGGHWESFAADVSNRAKPHFFVTEDARKGALQRFTPHNVTWDSPDEAWNMLHGSGTVEYLMMEPNSGRTAGTFWWGSNRANARNNAATFYPNSEGIDVHNSKLYFVCKKIKRLFELDLLGGTFTNHSTTAGLFDGGPDQLKRILNDGGDDLLFFTEEGGKDAGIHGRDATGLFFTLLESPTYIDESTGLAFSPDARHLYVAWQKNGLLFDITRLDGLPFHAKSLNVKYHAEL